MSVKSIISTEMLRTVVQTVAKPLYGHEFFLIIEEANEKDPSLCSYKGKQLTVHPSKREKKGKEVNANFSSALQDLCKCMTWLKNYQWL